VTGTADQPVKVPSSSAAISALDSVVFAFSIACA
jgi:hypothetical protein